MKKPLRSQTAGEHTLILKEAEKKNEPILTFQKRL